jgi:hypothetical protein
MWGVGVPRTNTLWPSSVLCSAPVVGVPPGTEGEARPGTPMVENPTRRDEEETRVSQMASRTGKALNEVSSVLTLQGEPLSCRAV